MASRFYYGMRLRGFAPGCQPMDGLIGVADLNSVIKPREYHDVISYDRKLSDEEIKDYELDYMFQMEMPE